MSAPQNLKNHVRFDPRFHFFVAPVLLLNVFVTIVLTVRYWSVFHWFGVWAFIIAVALLMTAGLARDYALRNQDRIIRLEERLRYASLLQPADLAFAERLSMRQIIALRFASDAELPTLMQRVAMENLDPKRIKQSIQVWREDASRV